MILTSMMNTLWHLPYMPPSDWDAVHATVQGGLSKPTRSRVYPGKRVDSPVRPTTLFDYFTMKVFPE